MKKLHMYLWMLLATVSLQSHPTICLNMVVKNEAESISACLESIKPWIDYWVIVDLESHDHTPDLIKAVLKEIPGELHIRPFVNLEYNRNQALQLGKERADYILFMDANEQLLSLSPPQEEGYFATLFSSQGAHHALRLVAAGHDWHWVGLCHPELYCPEIASLTHMSAFQIRREDVILPFNQMHPYTYQQLLALQELLKRKPSAARAHFLIAEIYRQAHCPERAFPYYKQRTELGGNEEEVFWSLYQLAEIQEVLGCPKQEVIDAYNRAYNFRPSRVEPRYRLARYYREQGDLLQGHLIAKLSLHLPPSNDKIPSVKSSQQWMHTYGLWFEYMLCSHYAGLHEEATYATLKLLSMPKLSVDVRGIAENVLNTEQLLSERAPIDGTDENP